MDGTSFGKKLFSFGKRSTKSEKVLKQKTQDKEKVQEIQLFAESAFNSQDYINEYYSKHTPDKAHVHIDKLQGLLTNTNDLLKAYVYSNHIAFVHASNRTLQVENDVVLLNSLLNNLKLTISTLPNENILVESLSEQSTKQTIDLSILGGNDTAQNTFWLSENTTTASFGNNNNSTQNMNSTQSTGGTFGIGGLYDKNNLMRIKMYKQGQTQHSNDYQQEIPLELPSIKDKYSKYIENRTSTKYKDEGGAVIQSLNNINIPINETINLIELSEDLQALIFERRLSEAVTLVELLVILGVLPPILQFDQSLVDRVNFAGVKKYLDRDSDDDQDDDSNNNNGLGFGHGSKPKSRSQPVKQRTLGSNNIQDESINPKLHYTSLDYVDNRLLNIKGPNPAHLRHRLAMSTSVLHENTSTLTNPPNYTRYSTTTTAMNNEIALFSKSTLQLQHEATNRQLLSENELDHQRARVYDNSRDLTLYNDGKYTFQPMLNLPVFPNASNAPINTAEISPTPGKRASGDKSLDFNTLYSLTPTPTTFSSIYGFGKQPPPQTWRLSHQIDALQAQTQQQFRAKGKKKESTTTPFENVITVKENKVIKNTNVTHYYTKQTKISTHLGKLVTVLVSLLLDELTHYVGTSWEQDERLLLLCRLNQQHLALHRFLLIQSNHIQEQLKKSRYKGDLRLFTLSICQIVFGVMQTTIRDFKRIFCHPDNNQPPTSSLPVAQQSGGSTTTTTTNTSSSSTTTTTSMTATITTPHNTYTYLRDDLLAHLSTWILLEISRLGRLIDQQLLHSHNKFQDFPNCINAVYEASLEIEQTLGTTTCNILVQCLHPSIVRTINDIAFLLEKNINELLQRDDWSPVSLNFTLVPISLQTPKDLLAKEAVEMIESNQRVLQLREQRNTLIAEFKTKQRELRRKEKEATKVIEKMAKLKAGATPEDLKDNNKDSDDDDDDDELSTFRPHSVLASINTDGDGDKAKELEKIQKAIKDLQPPKLPDLSPEEDVVFEKIRLHIASSAAAVYKSLLLFSKQLLSVLLCPIWRISQQSIETVAIDALCSFIDRLVKTLASVIRKHLATLFAPLPPDYLEFINAQQSSSSTQSSAMRLHQQANDITAAGEKKEKQINTQLLPSVPLKPANSKTSLVYKAGINDGKTSLSGQEIHSIAVSLQNQTSAKKQFKPLNEVQLSVILNSLSFISHYVFPYISLFISVNLCKPIPELLNACYKQKKMTLSAFEHVTKKKAQFFLRGRWYVQQDLQYRELLDQQQQLIKRLSREGKQNELLSLQDSIITLPNFKEDSDNINTLHLPFNGALFWVDSEDIHNRYISLPEFPVNPSLTSITNHMLSFLIHVYQQCHSYSLVLTPHQSKYMLRLLVDETCVGLLQTTGWETIFPSTNSALYMICDIKVMLYFCYALFGIIEETKTKREQIIRRVVRIYAKQYIVRAQTAYREQSQHEKEQKRQERTKTLDQMQEDLDKQLKIESSIIAAADDNNNPEVSRVGKNSSKSKGISLKGGDAIELISEESSDDDNDKKDDQNNITSKKSSSSSSSTTTMNGKKVTKTTTTTITSGSTLESNGKDRIAQNSPMLAVSLGLSSSKPLSMISMDDLNNDAFLAERLKEIDLGTDYYKMVAKQLLEYCGKHYLQTIQNYNLQDVVPNKSPQNPHNPNKEKSTK